MLSLHNRLGRVAASELGNMQRTNHKQQAIRFPLVSFGEILL
jgi:hypothetical protein